MENFGILLRGKSLENLHMIIDKFDDCYIVGPWIEELKILSELLKGKHIIQFVNSLLKGRLEREQYKEFNITEVNFGYIHDMIMNKGPIPGKNKKDLLDGYISFGVKKFEWLPDKHVGIMSDSHNTGITSIFNAAEIVKAKNIWIIGLDFYKNDYLTRITQEKNKGKADRLIRTFLKIVENYPQVNFNLLTYYKELPKYPNLHIIGENDDE